jgi:hypothetical protein
VAFDVVGKIIHVPNQVFLIDGDLVHRTANIVQEFDVPLGDRNKDLIRRPYPGLV